MNEQNFDYLKDNVKYLGFGEKQQEQLKEQLSAGKDNFQMTFSTEINKKKFEAVLNFSKSKTSDMYFLNNYRASLERSNGEKMDHTFYLEKGKGVTSKEAYNLLDGRSVFKELNNAQGESYKAWLQLDFNAKDKHQNFEVKQFHENYGYDLKDAVGKLPVKELDGAEKEDALMQSLKKGNVQSVTIDNENGKEQKYFLEANPQFKSVHIYNDQLQRLSQEDRLKVSERVAVKQEQVPDQSKDVKTDKKQSAKQAADGADAPVKKKSRKKSMSA